MSVGPASDICLFESNREALTNSEVGLMRLLRSSSPFGLVWYAVERKNIRREARFKLTIMKSLHRHRP